MTVIDLCCGLGGWMRGFKRLGWRTIGVDISWQALANCCYADELVQADIRNLCGEKIGHIANFIVASPPCDEFSRHDQPWTRARNPPPPDLSLVNACRRIQSESGLPMIMENVRGAQKWIGKCDGRWGSRYLWGDIPMLPEEAKSIPGDKERLPSTAKRERAIIPLDLSLYIAKKATEMVR